MRVLQLAVPYDVVTKSQDPLQSLAVLSAMAVCHPDLVDDGGAKGRVFGNKDYGFHANGFAVNKMLPFNYVESDLDDLRGVARHGLLLISKDATTLLRGLRHLEKSLGGDDKAYSVETFERVGLAVFAGRWSNSDGKTSRVGATLSMIAGNARQAAVRGFLYVMTKVDRAVMGRWYDKFQMKAVHAKVRDALGFDHFTTLDDLVSRVGRNGRLLNSCALIYICPSAAMPGHKHWSQGCVEPQMHYRLTLSEIIAKASVLFHK